MFLMVLARMAFYRPKLVFPLDWTGAEIPVIVYPDVKISEIFDRRRHGVIEEHISNVYRKNKDRFKTLGQYNIDILWADEGDPMLDIWVMDKVKEWDEQQTDSGALVEAEYTFRNLEEDKTKGIGAGLGMMVIAMEEVQRRRVEQKLGKDSSIEVLLRKYIYGVRPGLNFGQGFDFTPKQEFYL